MLTPAPALFVCSQLRWTAGIPALHYRLVTLATADSPPLLLYQTPSRVGASPLFPSPPPTRRNPIPKSNDILNSHGHKVDAQPRAHKNKPDNRHSKLVWSLKSERASDQLDFEDGRTSMTRGLNSAASIGWRSYGCCCVQIIDCPRPRGGEGCVWLSGKHQPEEVQSPPSVLARFVKSLESALPV